MNELETRISDENPAHLKPFRRVILLLGVVCMMLTASLAVVPTTHEALAATGVQIRINYCFVT